MLLKCCFPLRQCKKHKGENVYLIAKNKTPPKIEKGILLIITTTRKTGGLHLAYKARASSRDLRLQLSLTFKPIAI